MASSSPSGTPDSDGNASLAQVSDPSNTATMAPETLVVELQLHSEEAIERFAEIVQDDNASHQLASRNQTDFGTRSINRAARMDSNNAASGRGRGRETDNDNNAINRFPGSRNYHTLHHGIPVNTGFSLIQPLDNQPHRANRVYDEPRGLSGQNNRFAAERDEGAYSEGSLDWQPSSPPPASTTSATTTGCAARSQARQHTALCQTDRRSPVVVNSPRLVLRPNHSPNTTHRRPVAGQSARQTQAPLTKPRDAYNDFVVDRGGMSMMHGSYDVYDEMYNNNRFAIPRSSLTLRGHASSSAPRLQRPSTGISGIRRTTQPSTRPVYVPHHERERTSRNAVPESSRAAAARIAGQHDKSVMQSTENNTGEPVVAESEYADDDAGSDNDEPDESMGAQWRRGKEDEKTPILKRLGVVCEHVANCNTNSPFRKGISTFFGRNKKCIRDIPEEILVHFCRKHYQRCKFRDPVGWTRKQCEMITAQFDRIELWSNNNRANGVGAVVTHWTIELRKREAEKQTAKKRTTAATKKSSTNRNGRGKAPADSDDNDDDQEPSDGSPPNWMVSYIGQPLTFAQLRKIFDRLSREVLAVKTRKLPDIEFLPAINWIGGAKPAVVRYKKRAPASKPTKTPAKNSVTKGKGKAKSAAVEAEKEDDYVDEDFEDVMADSNEFDNGRKRKHDAEDDDDPEYHSRARRA